MTERTRFPFFLPFTSSPSRLLLLEADSRLQAFLESLLREEGYILQVVSSLEQALALASIQTFDLVLADLFSEFRRKAFKALQGLKQRLPSIKLGVITSQNVSPEEAERQGFAFVLPRPVGGEQLLTEIAVCLHKGLTPGQKRQARIVELFFEALTLKKKEQLLSLCTEDILCYPPVNTLLPLANTISGKTAVGQYLEALRSRYKTFRLEIERIYSRPRGLMVSYTLCWAEPDGSWELAGGSLLFQFTGNYIRQIGFPKI